MRDSGHPGRRDRSEVGDGAEAGGRAGCGERVDLCSGVMEKGEGQASQDTQLESRCRGKEGHRSGMEKLPKEGEENRKWGKWRGTEGRELGISKAVE